LEKQKKIQRAKFDRTKTNTDMLELLAPPKEKSKLESSEFKNIKKPKISLKNKILYKLEIAKKLQKDQEEQQKILQEK